eukprot:gene8351-biopygen7422
MGGMAAQIPIKNNPAANDAALAKVLADKEREASDGHDGTWVALLDGRWVQVPPKVVLQELAPDGRSHICANKTGSIFCFLGGSPKS